MKRSYANRVEAANWAMMDRIKVPGADALDSTFRVEELGITTSITPQPFEDNARTRDWHLPNGFMLYTGVDGIIYLTHRFRVMNGRHYDCRDKGKSVAEQMEVSVSAALHDAALMVNRLGEAVQFTEEMYKEQGIIAEGLTTFGNSVFGFRASGFPRYWLQREGEEYPHTIDTDRGHYDIKLKGEGKRLHRADTLDSAIAWLC